MDNNDVKVSALCLKMGNCLPGESYRSIITVCSKILAFIVLKNWPREDRSQALAEIFELMDAELAAMEKAKRAALHVVRGGSAS
jgi:hypothetical protein